MKPVLCSFDLLYWPDALDANGDPEGTLQRQRILAYNVEDCEFVAEFYGYRLVAVVPV